jgi:beta-1,4-N-acetylglucosaminyltransferase
MKRVVFIASTGGHLNELLQLKSIFALHEYLIITEGGPTTKHLRQQYPDRVRYLRFGSREHLLSYAFKFILNALLSLYYVLRYRPQVVVSTGTHTAVVFMYLSKLLLRSKLIYLETYANVHRGNLAGKLLHPIVDHYFVQWESLKAVYPKALYVGKIY